MSWPLLSIFLSYVYKVGNVFLTLHNKQEQKIKVDLILGRSLPSSQLARRTDLSQWLNVSSHFETLCDTMMKFSGITLQRSKNTGLLGRISCFWPASCCSLEMVHYRHTVAV